MSARPVAVVHTSTANLASVLAGLRRVGAEPHVTSEAEVVRRSDHVVLPGVGAFGAAAAHLREAPGMAEALLGRAAAGRPLLTICLGLQLLCEGSEESPDAAGLGLVPGTVTRFAEDLIVPQLGWNRVAPVEGARLLTPGWAYYANSYKLDAIPADWSGATSVHGSPFVAALERGDVLACQFHPELSGAWGHDLLSRWLDGRSGGR